MNAKQIAASVLIALASILSAPTVAQQSQAPQSPDTSAKIQVAVNSVIIPVVVRDAKGRAVGTLQKEDFQVFDNNKEQAISGFSVEKRAAVQQAQSSAKTSPTHPEIPAQPTQSGAAPARYIVFLFDDMHLEPSDLQQTQKVASKMIGASLSDSDLALVLSFSGANSGFTHDHAKLLDAIGSLKTQSLYRHSGHECPDVSYYQGSLILNQHNDSVFERAVQEAMGCAHTDLRSVAEGMATQAARRAVEIGDQDVHVTLDFMRSLVRKMATLPGQRTVILVSSGFLTVSPEAILEESQVLDAAADASVTISALDARGLFSAQLDASEQGAVTVKDLQTGEKAQYYRDTMTQGENVMSSLADGTGGTYFHNSNDLEGGFQKLAEVPEYIYMLEISLEKVKLDGSYHRLRVKVNQSGLTLQARREYFAPKKEKK
jgi:VWFA-related protein